MVRKTRKIEIDIYEDKIAEFYIMLASIKYSQDPNSDNLKRLADAISVDLEKAKWNIAVDEIITQKIRNKVNAIHNRLTEIHKKFNALKIKQASDYILVGKKTESEFLETNFASELNTLIMYNELFIRLYEKEKDSDFGISLASIVYFFIMIENAPPEITKIDIKSLRYNPNNTESKSKRLMDTITQDQHDKALLLFNYLYETYSGFITSRNSETEHNDYRDKMVGNVYWSLVGEYPSLSINSRAIITGYILAQMGLLDDEKLHDKSDRDVVYRKYLSNTVSRIISKMK